MKSFTGEQEFPYTPEQMFDLVADVESYQEYLPGWINAKILKREGNVAHVEQELGMGRFNTRFISKAIFKRPESINIRAANGLFRQLDVQWGFRPARRGGCIVDFNIKADMRSRYLEKLMKRYFIDLMEQTIAEVEERAEQLYSDRIDPAQLPEESKAAETVNL